MDGEKGEKLKAPKGPFLKKEGEIKLVAVK